MTPFEVGDYVVLNPLGRSHYPSIRNQDEELVIVSETRIGSSTTWVMTESDHRVHLVRTTHLHRLVEDYVADIEFHRYLDSLLEGPSWVI